MLEIAEFRSRVMQVHRHHYHEIDFARGIAIVGIVVMHAGWHFPESPLVRYASVLSAFSVPAFMAMAGFLMASSRDMSIIGMFRHKVNQLYWPFAFWTIIYLSYNVYFHGLDITPLLLFGAFFQGAAEQHLYFVPLIIASYAVFQFLKERAYSEKLILLGGLIVLLVVNSTGLRLAMAWSAFFFSLGFYLYRNPLHRHPRRLALLSAALVAAACFLLLFYTPTGTRLYLFALVPYSVSVIFLLLHFGYRLSRAPSLLDCLSRYSFSTYLAHWLALNLIDLLIPTSKDADFAIMTVGALAACYVLGRAGNAIPYGAYLVGRIAKGPDFAHSDKQAAPVRFDHEGSAGSTPSLPAVKLVRL